MIDLDPLLLSRIQFAFTISFHIIFPSFTIGLASWLAVVEWRWLKTGNESYKDLYQMWVKIFAVAFGLGVVSGVVMSYEFGTNWSTFSDRTANILGPLLGYEVLTAFFLEASFLGVMLFGWGRVSQRMHFTATVVVALGTLLSAFWILSANSWMQTPQGFRMDENGILYALDWMEVIFNPSFPYRLAHMVTAAYLTTAFVVGGVGAHYLYRKKHVTHARITLGMALLITVFMAPLQLFIGDSQGRNTLQHQPAKIAAIEAIWETQKGAPLHLLALPNQKEQRNDFSLQIPYLGSLILTHSWAGEIKGLKSWPRDDQPPVGIVFWSFRVMVGMGLLMTLTGIFAVILYFRKRLFDSRWFQVWCMAMSPIGFIAVLSGWFVAEVGRQPYIAYGIIRTNEGVSPIIGHQVALSLMAFIGIYTFIFGAGLYYIFKLIYQGPKRSTKEDQFYAHGLESSAFKGLNKSKQEKKNDI